MNIAYKNITKDDQEQAEILCENNLKYGSEWLWNG